MKRILIVMTTTILLIGCSDNGGIVELVENDSQISFITTKATSKTINTETVIKSDSEETGDFIFDIGNSDITIKGMLEFPGYTALEQNEISVLLQSSDIKYANIDLSSQIQELNKPLCLTLKFSGLNINEGDLIDFNYKNENDEFKDIEYGRLIVDYDSGWALVIKAKLYQFSKVGFTVKEKLN